MKKIFFAFFLLFSSQLTFSQEVIALKLNNEKYLRVRTGFMVDNYNSAGPRLYFEYLKQFRHHGKWFWGVAFENKWHLFNPMTDYYPPTVNTNSLSLLFHYKIHLWEDKLYWDVCSGLGGFIFLAQMGKNALFNRC